MSLIILHAILTICLLILSIIIYSFRKSNVEEKIIQEYESMINKLLLMAYGVLVGINLLIFVLIFSSTNYSEFNISSDILIINGSQFLFFVSIIFFIKSLKYHIEEDSLLFNYPTKRESNQGNIYIGKIIHNNKERYKYHLKLEDLERHMFVCGITGSGKSNFVQHFLINFQKIYT